MSGLFAGEVTQKMPADRALTNKKAGYMWMGYETETIAGAVTLSGRIAYGNGLLVRIMFGADGTVSAWEYGNGSWEQYNIATDWIIPNSDANSTYEFRAIGVTGSAFTESPAPDGTWVSVGSDLVWGLDGENNITDFVIEARKDGGAVITSGVYSLRVGDPG